MTDAKLHTLHLTVRNVEPYLAPSGDLKVDMDVGYLLTCPGCNGWIECVVEGCRQTPEYDDDSWGDSQDEEEREIHGVRHKWKPGWGWVVAYPGCVLNSRDLGDDFHEIAIAYGPGDYLVDDDWWDDTEVTIEAVSLADGSPLPEPGWLMRTIGGKA